MANLTDFAPPGALFTDPKLWQPKAAILAKRFGVIPFSVLDARQGYWQDRKRAWIALGIKGEEGRQDIEAANNICSPKWNRGADSEFYDANPERCAGHGLSESQERLDAFKERNKEFGAQQTGPNSPYRTHGYKKPDPVPGGGGPNSVRRLAPKDAGRCFGQDLIKGENENFGNAPRIVLVDGQWVAYQGGKRAAEFGVNQEAAQAWLDEKLRNVAAAKGYNFAAEQNANLDEATQRSLGVYAATNGAVQERAGGGVAGTSVFDPVLCECMYKWFAPVGGKILDPFAGESTKGIIASFLGYNYTGIELRPEQVKANNKQAAAVAEKVRDNNGEVLLPPTWIQGNSEKLDEVITEHDPFSDGYDFIWTSPPYYNLEIYSESESDGSAFESYEKFMVWYEDIFRQAVARLKPNRFVAVKVGEIRDDWGNYHNFERDNINVFERLGLHHYNRFVLVTAVGSLPVRVSGQFPKGRKCGNTHQMVYVFHNFKDPKQIPQELGILAAEDCTNAEQLAKLG